MLLNELSNGAHATVERVSAASGEIDDAAGGREPLAVLIGETMFGLRWLEAQCIEVTVDAAGAALRAAPPA